jgi:hypothetical protein
MSVEERRLAGLLKQAVPAPPRELSAEEIMVTTHDRSRKAWMLPALSAAAVLIIGVTVGVIASQHTGTPKTNFAPAAGQSSVSPSVTASPVPIGPVPSATASPVPIGPVPSATPVPVPTGAVPSASPVPVPVPSATATPVPIPTSSPRGAVVVPAVVGETEAQAAKVLQSAGLNVRIVAVRSSNSQHPPQGGTVWSQSLPPGSAVAKGATITVDVQPA